MSRILVTAVAALAFIILLETPGHAGQKVPQNKVIHVAVDLIAPYENPLLNQGAIQQSWPHYPGNESHAVACSERGCTNGCTIGFGYNMGARWPREVRADLSRIGVDQTRIERLANFAHKRGKAAYEMCGSQLGWEKITRNEALALLSLEVKKAYARVMSRVENEGTALSTKQLAVLVALDYQNPNLSSEATNLWKHIQVEDWYAVGIEIRQRSGTKFLPALKKRRNVEAQVFLTASGDVQMAEN